MKNRFKPDEDNGSIQNESNQNHLHSCEIADVAGKHQKEKLYSAHEREIIDKFLMGWKVDELGEQYTLSRYKVTQILSKYGITRDVRNQQLIDRIEKGQTVQEIIRSTQFKRSFLYNLAKESGIEILDITRQNRLEQTEDDDRSIKALRNRHGKGKTDVHDLKSSARTKIDSRSKDCAD